MIQRSRTYCVCTQRLVNVFFVASTMTFYFRISILSNRLPIIIVLQCLWREFAHVHSLFDCSLQKQFYYYICLYCLYFLSSQCSFIFWSACEWRRWFLCVRCPQGHYILWGGHSHCQQREQTTLSRQSRDTHTHTISSVTWPTHTLSRQSRDYTGPRK